MTMTIRHAPIVRPVANAKISGISRLDNYS